ncbi:hypothetical protein P7C70_g4025, partial [Phenoliferia sp. Uapishka_3]
MFRSLLSTTVVVIRTSVNICFLPLAVAGALVGQYRAARANQQLAFEDITDEESLPTFASAPSGVTSSHSPRASLITLTPATSNPFASFSSSVSDASVSDDSSSLDSVPSLDWSSCDSSISPTSPISPPSPVFTTLPTFDADKAWLEEVRTTELTFLASSAPSSDDLAIRIGEHECEDNDDVDDSAFVDLPSLRAKLSPRRPKSTDVDESEDLRRFLLVRRAEDRYHQSVAQQEAANTQSAHEQPEEEQDRTIEVWIEDEDDSYFDTLPTFDAPSSPPFSVSPKPTVTIAEELDLNDDEAEPVFSLLPRSQNRDHLYFWRSSAPQLRAFPLRLVALANAKSVRLARWDEEQRQLELEWDQWFEAERVRRALA